MAQQVWAFLATTPESWAARDLARRLDMPERTVRAQLARLVGAGKVERRFYKGGGRLVWKAI
jgi:predicted ArsR family transcriptional regulator